MTPRERATRLLAIKVIRDRITAEERRIRDEMAGELMVGERVPGALDPADSETLLGFVQLTKAREAWQVADRDAFTEWVAEQCPDELITIPAREDVRTSFVAKVLADCKAHGGWVSPAGEVVAPDGVECRTGEPILTVKPTAEADYLVAEALAAHRLELTSGDL